MDRHQLSAFIESKRQEIVLSNDPSPHAQFLKAEAELTQALPIWLDIWGCLALRSDLTVVVHNDWKDSVTIETDQARLNFVFSLASRRYPELKALKPVRPQQTTDCTHCRGGRNYEDVLKLGLECACGGLGWLPASQCNLQK